MLPKPASGGGMDAILTRGNTGCDLPCSTGDVAGRRHRKGLLPGKALRAFAGIAVVHSGALPGSRGAGACSTPERRTFMHGAKSSAHFIVRTALLLWLVLGPVRSLAAGLDEELEFDLPGGPLGETLLAVARRAGTVNSFRLGLADPHTAAPIRGLQVPGLLVRGLPLRVTVLDAGTGRTRCDKALLPTPIRPSPSTACAGSPAPAAYRPVRAGCARCRPARTRR